ncbi:hypothetical protein BDP27DRAFT_1373320 [Rhodocollybia butyracea]|uniref:Uncharacterized protein n=1 Tax=Rhodocollybia butyracea TaxID=206335 RepID=A0A9P5TWQ2_9AGAR|nr:hypothetical protein BDP27DRAFT_1373320 [Rhodocollybia butyracea]
MAISLFPCEILTEIFFYCSTSDLLGIILCGKTFYKIAVPVLYSTVIVKSSAAFDRYLSAWDRDSRINKIKMLSIGSAVHFDGPVAISTDEPVALVWRAPSQAWLTVFATLPDCPRLSNLVLRHLHVPQGFAGMLAAMPSLTVLSLENCGIYGDSAFGSCSLGLRKLEMRRLRWHGPRKDFVIAYHCFRIQVLVIDWWHGAELEVGGEKSLATLLESLTLVSLVARWDIGVLIGGIQGHSKFSLGITRLLRNCPQVLSFAVEGFLPGIVPSIPVLLPSLVELRVPLDFLMSLPPSFAHLTHLCLTNSSLGLCLLETTLPFLPGLKFFASNMPFWSTVLFQCLAVKLPVVEVMDIVWDDKIDPSRMVLSELPLVVHLFRFVRKLSFVHLSGDEKPATSGVCFIDVDLPMSLVNLRVGRHLWLKSSAEQLLNRLSIAPVDQNNDVGEGFLDLSDCLLAGIGRDFLDLQSLTSLSGVSLRLQNVLGPYVHLQSSERSLLALVRPRCVEALDRLRTWRFRSHPAECVSELSFMHTQWDERKLHLFRMSLMNIINSVGDTWNGPFKSLTLESRTHSATDLLDGIRGLCNMPLQELSLRLSYPPTRINISLTKSLFVRSLTNLTLMFDHVDLPHIASYFMITKVLKDLPFLVPGLQLLSLCLPCRSVPVVRLQALFDSATFTFAHLTVFKYRSFDGELDVFNFVNRHRALVSLAYFVYDVGYEDDSRLTSSNWVCPLTDFWGTAAGACRVLNLNALETLWIVHHDPRDFVVLLSALQMNNSLTSLDFFSVNRIPLHLLPSLLGSVPRLQKFGCFLEYDGDHILTASTTFYNLVFGLLTAVTEVSVSFWPTPWPAATLVASQMFVLGSFKGNVLGSFLFLFVPAPIISFAWDRVKKLLVKRPIQREMPSNRNGNDPCGFFNNDVELQLLDFDHDLEYGPGYGLTRFERWKRAESLGLNPPLEILPVLEILQDLSNHPWLYRLVHAPVINELMMVTRESWVRLPARELRPVQSRT